MINIEINSISINGFKRNIKSIKLSLDNILNLSLDNTFPIFSCIYLFSLNNKK